MVAFCVFFKLADKHIFDSGACGFTMIATNKFVHFHSPGYPNDHPANLDCRWLIISEEVNKPVELHINDLNLEQCCDSLEVC